MLFICLRRANCNGHGAQSLDKVQLAWLPGDVVVHGWNVCCVPCQEKVRQRHLAIKHNAMARLWTTAQETTRDHFTQVAVPLDSVRVLSYFFYFFLIFSQLSVGTTPSTLAKIQFPQGAAHLNLLCRRKRFHSQHIKAELHRLNTATTFFFADLLGLSWLDPFFRNFFITKSLSQMWLVPSTPSWVLY